MSIEPYFLHCLDEPHQIVPPLKIILKKTRFQKKEKLSLELRNKCKREARNQNKIEVKGAADQK